MPAEQQQHSNNSPPQEGQQQSSQNQPRERLGPPPAEMDPNVAIKRGDRTQGTETRSD